jgi:hypothetical protein
MTECCKYRQRGCKNTNYRLKPVAYLCGGYWGFPPPLSKKKNLKTSNFKHISNIIIIVCLFNKVLKYNKYIIISIVND